MKISSNSALAAIAFFITLAMTAAFAPFDFMDMTHEAQVVIPAYQILAGKLLFRDIFSQYGAVPTYINALSMLIFEQGLLSARLATSLAYSFSALFLFLTWRRFIPSTLALLAVALWNLLTYHLFNPFLAWPAAYALAFQSIAIWALITYLHEADRRWLLLAGTMATITMLCKQNVGMYLLFSLLVAAALPPKGANLRYASIVGPAFVALGFGLTMLTFVGWLVANHALQEWWAATFLWPREWARIYGGGFNPIVILERLTAFRIFGSDLFNPPSSKIDLIFVLMPIIVGAVFYSEIKECTRTKGRSKAMIALCLLCGASWLQYYPVPGIGHVWWASAPMFGVVLYGIWLVTGRVAFRMSAFIIITALLFAPGTIRRVGLLIEFIQRDWQYVALNTTPFYRLWIEQDRLERIAEVDHAVSQIVDRDQRAPPILLEGDAGLLLAFVPQYLTFHPFWMIDDRNQIPIIDPNWAQRRHNFIVDMDPVVFTTSTPTNFIEEFPHYSLVSQALLPRRSYDPIGIETGYMSILAPSTEIEVLQD